MSDEELVYIIFEEDADLMWRISKCESGQRQFDSNGNVIKSPTGDYGLFQINDRSWSLKAKELGLDYKNNSLHNILMAKYIKEVQGVNAWACYKKVV